MSSRTSLLALSALFLALPCRAQTTLRQFQGAPNSVLSRCVGGHDLNSDGVDDVVLGASFDGTLGASAGVVSAYSGATGGLLWVRYGSSLAQFGHALAMSPDLDGDGVWDLVVGAPAAFNGAIQTGAVYLLSGRTGAILSTFYGGALNDGMGSAVAADFDLNQDGTPDIAGGAPYAFSTKGLCRVWSGLNGSTLLSTLGAAGALKGISLLGAGDLDGDGFGDLAIGAFDRVEIYGPALVATISDPNYFSWLPALGRGGDRDQDGRADLLIGDPWNDFPKIDNGAVYLVTNLSSSGYSMQTLMRGDSAGEKLGTQVAGLTDIDGDGFADWALSAVVGSTGTSQIRVISGRFQQELYRVSGLGTRVAGVGDINSDGVPDLGVGDSSAANSFSGQVTVFSGFGPGFVNYCTAGSSSNGCQPTLSGSGVPSATQPTPFVLTAVNVEGASKGLFFFGANGRQASAWGNGTSFQCVLPPVRRASILSGTGTNGQCDGVFSQDLNALWCPACPKPLHNPGAGAVVQAQLWYRDNTNTSNQTTSLSNALEFAISP